jgi:hypothetical protein
MKVVNPVGIICAGRSLGRRHVEGRWSEFFAVARTCALAAARRGALVAYVQDDVPTSIRQDLDNWLCLINLILVQPVS